MRRGNLRALGQLITLKWVLVSPTPRTLELCVPHFYASDSGRACNSNPAMRVIMQRIRPG